MIHAPEKERKPDERSKIKKEIRELSALIARGRTRIEELQKQLEEPRELIFTRHAIERYKERIEKLPDQVIKKIIKQGGVLEKYLKNGSGRHRLTNRPGVLVVIHDYTVVTVLAAKDPLMKLELLEQYMDYWVEQRCKQVSGAVVPIIHFREYIKTLYE